MSAANPGGKPNLKLTPDTYAPGHSTKLAEFTGGPPSTDFRVKLGLRIKSNQTPTLTIKSKHTGTYLTLTADQTFLADLNAALPCASDEKWVPYMVDYDHGLKHKFDTDLTLNPFNVPANGFQIVTTAFCHEDQNFQTGAYSYAISVLPGGPNTDPPPTARGIMAGSPGGKAKARASRPRRAKTSKKPAPRRRKKRGR